MAKKKLHWHRIEDPSMTYYEAFVMVNVPAPTNKTGHWYITMEPRPLWCDRGRWYVKVSPLDAFGLDSQEGFPRYYFDLKRGRDEMNEWINCRDEIISACDEEQTLALSAVIHNPNASEPANK